MPPKVDVVEYQVYIHGDGHTVYLVEHGAALRMAEWAAGQSDLRAHNCFSPNNGFSVPMTLSKALGPVSIIYEHGRV